MEYVQEKPSINAGAVIHPLLLNLPIHPCASSCAAIEAQKGDISDKTALVNAMLKVDMTDDPRGPVTLDPTYHSAIENVYIREVTKGDRWQTL